MKISEFQQLIEDVYGEKDLARGTAGTFMWFVEEVGELARALKGTDRRNLEEEFADVLAWLTTLASMHGVDLQAAACAKYQQGCPRCGSNPCSCSDHRPVHSDLTASAVPAPTPAPEGAAPRTAPRTAPGGSAGSGTDAGGQRAT